MRTSMVTRTLLLTSMILATFGALSGQQIPTLEFNKATPVTISAGEVKEYTFKGKKGDYWEIKTPTEASIFISFELLAPTGEEILKNQDTNAPALILPADGEYKLRVFCSPVDGKPGPYSVDVVASDRFALPKGSKKVTTRRVNGYTITIYKSEEEYLTALEIVRSGKRLAYLLGDSTIPFSFMDHSIGVAGTARKRERELWQTADKTGDGVPDIAIEYYSGGAHCCYTYYFYELGDQMVQRPTLSTADAGLAAVRVNPGGGLRLRTADMAFAYWNIYFAGSPSPKVILDFKNSQWRPNFSAMKKPSPTAAKLQTIAARARKLMNDKPYRGDEFAVALDEGYLFEEAFWGTMLDLIYTGNENEAWKFMDDVWPKTKPGKELFLRDFKEQLGKSLFWQMIKEDSAKP